MVNIASRNSITEKPIVSLRETPSFITTNSQFATDTLMSLFHRVLLLITFMVVSVGSVWGAETTLSTGNCNIDGATFSTSVGDATEIVLRVYCDIPTGSNVWFNTQWYRTFLDKATYDTSDSEYNSENGCLEFNLSSSQVSTLKTEGLIVLPNVSATISKVVWDLPAADDFLGSEATGATTANGSQEIARNTSTAQTIDLTGVSLSGVKYARIYLADVSGTALSDQSKLTVTYDGNASVAAGSSTKNGVYVYNAGDNLDLSKVSITLDAGEENFDKYQIICLLSTSQGTPAAGPLTKEPDWNLTYTFTFTYPILEIPLAMSVGDLLEDHIVLHNHDVADAKLKELSGSSSISSYYNRWYVRHKTSGVRQTLALPGTVAQDATKWIIQTGYNGSFYVSESNLQGWSVTNNAAERGSTDNTGYNDHFGHCQIYLPTSVGTKMLDASDYEIVFECTDEYAGGTPSMKVRYIYQFPEIGEFEGEANTGATESSSTQTVADRAAASVAVDVATQASGAKYARFYVTDAQGTAVDPTSLLEVKYNGTDATACTNVNSGFYIYNDGSAFDASLISVTLKAPKAYKAYKVVALLSTALAKMTYAASTMIEEPDYDLKHTYSFDYTITTSEVEKTIEWDATAMAVDASAATDIDTDWKTSLEEMSAGQCIKWYVVNGSEKQTLEIGTERQYNKWTIGLPAAFTVAENVASLSGLTTVTAEQLATWVATNVYAPSNKTYADIASSKIVCEIYTNNEGTGAPNARYTFSLHKAFVGSLKATASPESVRIQPAVGDITNAISITLSASTKYLRAYLTDANGTPVDPTGKLSITDGRAILTTVDGYDVKLGSYIYNSEGLTSPASVTLTLTDATLDQYHVVVLTSKDAAVVDGDGNVTSEPDWDTQTTYWFKYPSANWATEANVEWSAQSMQVVAPAIETEKGAGYLENNKSHYTMQWYVVDKDGTTYPLRQGSNRVNDYWSLAINGSPFALSGDNKLLTVTNDSKLSTTTWANWAAPVFYAPANKTMREISEAEVRFVCKFYEDDNTSLDEANLLAMTYTVYIDRQEQLGKLKDGGKRGGETITSITAGQTETTISLKDASDAFETEIGKKPTYARVYLTKSDGTLLDPTTGEEMLTGITGATGFTTKEYGYYLQDESGLTLPNATLTLPANKFNYYYVVVAMSADTGETGHTGAFAPRRAASVASVYEPDYDYIYTIKFAETSTFPGTVTSTAFTHSNEVLVASESATSAALNLADRESKILTEFKKASFSDLASNFHVRWYITKKNDDGDFEKIPNSEAYFEPKASQGHQSEENQGLYWNSVAKTTDWTPSDAKDILNVTFNRNPGGGVPELTGNWEDYKVYVVLTTDLSGQTDDGGSPKKLTHEPNNLTMVHTYSFFTESTFLFVHDKGASERPYITPSTDADLKATVQQYTWDNSVSTIEPATGDIRQGVHTVEYDVYVDPTSSTPVILHLPFQNYTGSGDALEPAAYIRWYDWNTDINNNRLAMVGTKLADKTETNQGATVSRGFFMLNNDEKGVKPIQDLVGVTFNPLGLTDLTSIACDVSKFYDGIYTGSAGEYLMHEPTLSTRYIFRVRPASVIATDIKIGQQKFEAGGSNMFQLAEDNGRVSVAIKDASTKFSVRAQLPMLGYYYINNGGSQLNCNKITWWAYYEDETGVYRKDDMASTYKEQDKRIVEINVGDLNGSYTPVSGGSAKPVTASKGGRFHIVGYVGDGTNMAPAIHYEMILVDAPAYKISELPLERTEAYLREHMTLQATVDFDNECGLTLSSTLDSQLDNHSTKPLPWDEAQYGFCYPDVRRIEASNDDLMGISPLHGDYMLLKSMNKAGISADGQGTYYKYHWWQSGELLDYTYYNGMTDKGKYGSFLYVDASDESRTIAQMKFNANLCVGSELCFTGYIADMTSGTEYPQMMATVYGIKANGDRVKVVSFHSSNLSTVTTAATISYYKKATWYQMYGRVAIPNTVDLTGVVSYVVDIDNYATQTNGADYAVDQLQFFTSNAKLKVKQKDAACDADKIKINIYVDAEAIQSKIGSNIFWRICDENGNPMSAAMKLYDDAGTLTYGTTAVTAPTGTIDSEATFDATTPNNGYFIGTDGNTYFSLASKYFALEQGKQYYVSVYSLSETSVGDPSLWGKNTDACDIYSPIFIPKRMYLTMKDGSDNIVTSVDGDCSTGAANVNLKVVLNMPDDDEVSGFKEYDGVHFDFFLGTKATYEAYELSSVKLSDALEDFRTSYPSATSIPSEYSSAKADNAAVIQQAVGAGLLFLDASSTFSHSISTANNTVMALPIEKVVNNGTTNFNVCSPLEYVFTINTTGSAPTLNLGFSEVTYPAGIRIVRVGREQLLNMQKDGGYLLHIPVHDFAPTGSATALEIVGDLDLVKYQGGENQTTDSEYDATGVDKVATFAETVVSSSKMYISINFHGTGVTKPAFKEGFAYRMFFQVKDEGAGTGACEATVEFLLKVVPEFVTWNGTTSSEWNNDANWKRSERVELYKGTDATTNTATDAQGDGTTKGLYKNNSEMSISTTPATFVPMKFTYVTLPTGTRAPNLVNLTYDTEKIYNNIGATATTNIQYDLMVRYTEKTCQDHSISGDVYDCEKFYGNWAKELYMKPAAELVNQQYLTYEKVWVEKELTSNTWTLMSTPLQNTYAGDMYVPYSATADDNGRQLTEAFQPINFSTTADAAGFVYSRTKYPIYQKGWTQQGVYVYTKTNDVRATKYSANIPGGVSTILNQWSHSYNDVMVSYSTWTAFAIRPHKKAQTAKTLIRLPKADASYDYYQWDNTSPTDGKLTQNVAKSTTGKLLTDGTANISGVTYGTVYGTTARTAGDGSFNTLITNIQSSPANYQLVGNPYLCSIDMATFISGNSANLDVAGYWTYNDNNTGTPVTTGTIAPMQSFFVKAKSGATEIVFTPSMMKDGTSSSTPAPAMTDVPVLMLTAQNDRGTSKASVVMGEGQSVETLFDSNLEDVPMVYTVADGQAVSINHAAQLEAVSFGVTCKSEEAVDVAMTGLDTVGGSLYVFDAVDGTSTTVSEGSTISVMPNEYGRYFLTRSTSLGEVKEGLADGIRVSVHGGEVNITASSDLGMVRAMSIGGATMYQATNCGTTTSFALQQGVYVIETDGAAGNKTMKIVVK